MEDRKELIQEWINKRKEAGEKPVPCMFHITVPRADVNLREDKTIRKVEEILVRNGVSSNNVDTVPGAWNLNRDWVETGLIDCIVEFCGVYPVGWNMDDVVELERMETEGEIIICVSWLKDGKYVLNH